MANKHMLDVYKTALELYNVVLVTKDDKQEIVIIDRNTGNQIPDGALTREESVALAKDLIFTKAWIKACGNDLSLAGDKNQYGIDSKQWEYAFNNGAKETYDNILDAISDNNQIDAQKITQQVLENSNYKYAKSICDALLNREYMKYDFQYKVVNDMLAKNAHIKQTQRSVESEK